MPRKKKPISTKMTNMEHALEQLMQAVNDSDEPAPVPVKRRITNFHSHGSMVTVEAIAEPLIEGLPPAQPTRITKKVLRASNIEACSYTGVRLPVSLKQKLRNLAVTRNLTLSVLIIQILSGYLLEQSDDNDIV